MKEHQLIRRSTPILLTKIFIAEIINEIVYLILTFGVISAANNGIIVNPDVIRLTINIIMASVGISLLIVIISLWVNEGLLVDEDEIVYQKGVLKTTHTSYPYTNIQRVTVHQTLLGKIFNYGSIDLYVPVLGQDLIFTEMPSPHKIAKLIKKQIEKPAGHQFLLKK